MNNIHYPSERILRFWIASISKPAEGNFLIPYLPEIDEDWYATMCSVFNLIRIPHYPQNFEHQAAHLFYKICKNHYLINSNKRSAVIVLYLFCLLNMFFLKAETEAILSIARETVESDPRSSEEYVLQLEQKIAQLLAPLFD